MIEKARTPATGVFATILSLITLLLGVSGVVGELKDTLNTIWHVEPALEMGLLRTLKTRLASLAFVLGIGFLLLVSLVISAVLSALNGFFSHLFSSPWLLHVFQVVNFVVSLGVITVLFAILYRFLPDTEIPWHDVWIGAGITALLFVVSKSLLGLYLGRSSIGSAYGPAGAPVLVLAWVYYSSLVFLFGAEFTKVYAHRYGSRATSAAAPPPTARPHSASDATRREKRIQSRLRTLRDSRAQFCLRHGHRGKTPRAIFLTSLVLVLHKSRVRKEAYATVRRQDAEAMVTPERGAT
jgi:membrane protein